MSLLCEIKKYQIYANFVELGLNYDDIIYDKRVIEVHPDSKIVYLHKFLIYGNKNSTHVFYLRSNLGSNFFIQTHVNET
jgi:hypothetical protein